MNPSEPCNRFVFFGATGDLAAKQIFPALQALAGRGLLDMPVVAVARSDWTRATLIEHARQSIEQHDRLDPQAFTRLTSRLQYVRGDYQSADTYTKLVQALDLPRDGRGDDSARVLCYLAIPPESFTTVINHLGQAGLAARARVVVEKPFGRDLASARALNAAITRVLPEHEVYRIDHFLGKEAVQNLLYFRLANAFVASLWDRHHVDAIQITMAESFGIRGRGAFYEQVGAVRDVIQNHLFQVLSLLTAEPVTRIADVPAAKARVLSATRSLRAEDIVRGQFQGYRTEPGVAPDSRVETYAAMRLSIDNERWRGVPISLRAGKCLPVTATEVYVLLRPVSPPPFDCAGAPGADYFRFRLDPDVTIALGGRIKKPGEGLTGEPTELIEHQPEAGRARPYERLLGDALAGDPSLFAGFDGIEAAWKVVDRILDPGADPLPYAPGSWGPAGSERVLPPGSHWIDPQSAADHG